MRLLNDQPKKAVDLKKEIAVALTLEEIATIYAVFAQESGNSTEAKLREQGFDNVADSLDCFTNDLPYDLYRVSEKILEAEGLVADADNDEDDLF